MKLSRNKEDYLKTLFHLCQNDSEGRAATKDLASLLEVSPASVNSMLKKLKSSDLVDYEKYGKIKLTDSGQKLAVHLIRKHRLWETFLFSKLGFSWDEVHEIAEQLEHVQSVKLVDQLDKYLGYPKVDPHGDKIPASDGLLVETEQRSLSEVGAGKTCKLVAVDDSSSELLQHVSKIGLSLNQTFEVLDKRDFDQSLLLKIKNKEVWVSSEFSRAVFVL